MRFELASLGHRIAVAKQKVLIGLPGSGPLAISASDQEAAFADDPGIDVLAVHLQTKSDTLPEAKSNQQEEFDEKTS